MQLVKCCLKNTASQRPTAEDVLRSLEEMKPVTDGPCGEVARIDAVRQVVMMRAILGRETEVRRKTDESAAKDEEIHQLQQELEQEQVWSCDLESDDYFYDITLRLNGLGLMRSFINGLLNYNRQEHSFSRKILKFTNCKRTKDS